MSPAVVPHMGKVCSIVRNIYGRSPTDDLNDFDVNTSVWNIFMNVTLQAAVHQGRDYMENLRLTKNKLLKSVKQSFQVTEKSKELTWRSTSLLCDKAFEITNDKTFVFPDSVLCLGSMRDQLVEAWKNKIKWYLEIEISKIWIESMESRSNSRGKYSQDSVPWTSSKTFKKLTEPQCELEQFKDRIIFMSMYNDIVWWEQRNTEKWEKSVTVANFTRRFRLSVDQRRNGTELALINQTEIGTKLLNKWCSTLQKAVIQKFRLEKQSKGKDV